MRVWRVKICEKLSPRLTINLILTRTEWLNGRWRGVRVVG